MKIEEMRMVDISGAEGVQVQLSADQKTVWVNVDGICLLRAQRTKTPVTVDGLAVSPESRAG